MGSPATLLMMRTPTAPAALAFATFWLKVHVPRSMIANLPEAPGSTLVHPSEWVSKRSNEAAGNGSKSPTAAPITQADSREYQGCCEYFLHRFGWIRVVTFL